MIGFLVSIPIIVSIFFLKWQFVIILAVAHIIFTLILLWCLSKCFGLDLMSGTDHVFHEIPESSIAFYVVAEKRINDFQQFKQIILKNLFPNEKPLVNYHKLKQYPKKFLFMLNFWKKDKDFNIDNHVFSEKKNFGGKKDQLTQWFQQLFNEIFPSNKPKWKVILVENFNNNKSAIIFKIHHSYADGIGCASLFLTMFGITSSKAKFIQLRKPSAFQYYFKFFLSVILAPFLIGKTLISAKQQNNKFHPQLPKRGNKIAISNQITLQKLKNCAKRKYGGCSINDLLLVVFSQAIEAIYKQQFNEELKEMTVTVPVSMRNLPTIGSPPYLLENKFLGVQMNLPFSFNQSTQERLSIYQKITNYNLKSNLSIFALYLLTLFMEAVFPSWVNQKIGEDVINKSSFIFSSVPGPSNTIEVFGNIGLDEVHGFTQTLYQCGILALVVSYNEKIALNLIIDQDTPIDPQVLVNKFEEIMAQEVFAQGMGRDQQYSINSVMPDLEGNLPGDRRQSVKYVAFEDDDDQQKK